VVDNCNVVTDACGLYPLFIFLGLRPCNRTGLSPFKATTPACGVVKTLALRCGETIEHNPNTTRTRRDGAAARRRSRRADLVGVYLGSLHLVSEPKPCVSRR
jgi:hypothetical protein